MVTLLDFLRDGNGRKIFLSLLGYNNLCLSKLWGQRDILNKITLGTENGVSSIKEIIFILLVSI